MGAEEGPVRTEEQDRAIERAAVALDDTDDEMEAVVARDRPEAVDRRSRHVHRALVIAAEPFPTFGRSPADLDIEVSALRVARDERLREDRQLRSGRRRVTRQARHAVECRLAVEGDRRRLHD